MFDVSDVPSFNLSLLFPFSLTLRLPLPLRASHLCSLVAVSLTNLHHSESSGCVPVLMLCLCPGACPNSAPRTAIQDIPTRPRPVRGHRSISTSVHRLPHFQKSSPDLETSHWIAKSRDHLDCSIFRVHHQHERKLLYSFLSTIAHSRQGHFSQRIRFNICEFRTELFINRKRLRLVSEPEVNWFSSVFLGMLENWSSCRSRFIDHHLL